MKVFRLERQSDSREKRPASAFAATYTHDLARILPKDVPEMETWYSRVSNRQARDVDKVVCAQFCALSQ